MINTIMAAILSATMVMPGLHTLSLSNSGDSYNIYKTPAGYRVDMGTEVGGNLTDYVKLYNFFNSLSESDTVTLSLHNFGGSVASGLIVMNALKTTKAHTIAEVNGISASMGALIACGAEKVDMKPYSFLMFHNGEIAVGGKTSDNMYLLKAVERLDRYMLGSCVQHGILTKSEINDIIAGIDIYKFKDDIKS